jgi:hypothetical protein
MKYHKGDPLQKFGKRANAQYLGLKADDVCDDPRSSLHDESCSYWVAGKPRVQECMGYNLVAIDPPATNV